MLVGVIALMGLPWIIMPNLSPPPEKDVHVVQLVPTPRGYRAPFGKGRLELGFFAIDGGDRARLELFDAAGARLALPASTTVHLELPGNGTERTQVAFERKGAALVSIAPLAKLPDRSTLVLDDERTRHVYALEGSR
jgi:hypothetical protein